MNSSSDKPKHQFPNGVYPAMITPFHEDQSIDFEKVDQLTDFYIESGVAGIFAAGLSAEIMWMSNEEKIQLVERIVKKAAGRVHVVGTGITFGTLEEQAELICRTHDTGADVVAFAVSQLAEESDDSDVWIQQAESLLKLVPDEIGLAFYECPLPYWRLLSDKDIEWAAKTGRFHFMKDTCCNIDVIRRRLDIIKGTPLQLFNANTETLLDSLNSGADGFCGIGANYQPELFVWLCDQFRNQSELASELHQFLDETLDLTEGKYYPVSAKEYLHQRGLDVSLFGRKLPPNIPEEFKTQLAGMLTEENHWKQKIS
jgi:4-hydroxy-tetrahydrodipicolinate synthase